MNNILLGQKGEEFAAEYLLAKGYKIVQRNWRTRYGELDIIAHDGDTVVAVEVKTRSGTGYGAPLEAITYAKARRLKRLLGLWLDENWTRRSRYRVDGIGITLRATGEPLLEHVEAIA